jgi:hypothetical protein
VLAAQQHSVTRNPVLRAPEVSDDDLRGIGVLASRFRRRVHSTTRRCMPSSTSPALLEHLTPYISALSSELDRIQGLAAQS